MQYLLRESASPTVFDINPKTAKEYAKIFDNHNANYPRAKNPLYFLSIRFPDQIRPSREEFGELAKDVLEGMGLGLNRPYLVVRHKNEAEEPGTHIHVVCSRIDYSGKIWFGRNDAKQAIAICRELGKPERFKDVDPGYVDRNWGQDLSTNYPATRPETQIRKRTGEWLDKDHVGASLALILHSLPRRGQPPMNSDFIKGCATYGISPRIIERTNGRQGLVYNYEGVDHRASSFGKVYTLHGLSRYFNSKIQEQPALTLPPKNSVTNLATHAFNALDKKGRLMRVDEKQELPEATGLYDMARALKRCEFDDLRTTGESIEQQLSYKMMPQDVLSIYKVYVRIIFLDLQNRRQELEKLKALQPTLIRIQRNELDATDEEYRELILPRIKKFSRQDDTLSYESWKDTPRQEDRYPYKGQCIMRALQIEEAKKFKADCENRAHAAQMEIEEAKFNGKGVIGKILHKKNNPLPAKPAPFKYSSEVELLEAADIDIKSQRQKTLFDNYDDLRERGISQGVVIARHDGHAADAAPRRPDIAEYKSVDSTDAAAKQTIESSVASITEIRTAETNHGNRHTSNPVHSPSKASAISRSAKNGRAKRQGGPDR